MDKFFKVGVAALTIGTSACEKVICKHNQIQLAELQQETKLPVDLQYGHCVARWKAENSNRTAPTREQCQVELISNTNYHQAGVKENCR